LVNKKGYSDLNNKAGSDAFYRAHGFWFVEEMDNIVKRVPRQGNPPADVNSFSDVLRVVSKVLLDSVLLFEHWGTYRAGVPGVYGIGKNDIEHIMAFYQGARQTIYGHGSCGLSFADNHSDLATAAPDEVSQPRLTWPSTLSAPAPQTCAGLRNSMPRCSRRKPAGESGRGARHG
jgi:hypothetical protein